jgi:Uncharacterized iron-regulated membrane protein
MDQASTTMNRTAVPRRTEPSSRRAHALEDAHAAMKNRRWHVRHLWVLVHRYAGLYMAFFLTVAGVTGSFLAFYEELDVWLNPHLHTVAPQGTKLDAADLIERAEQLLPQGQVNWVSLAHHADQSFIAYFQPRTDPATGEPFKLEYDEVFVDPYRSEVLGTRQWGAISLAPEHLMPFVYRLHYELALPNRIGIWLFGIAAIIWTLDCFVGLYLTLPRGRPFWKKWAPAWKVKRSRLNFDLHRAFGLWIFAMLFVFAWSAVYLNLGREVYLPVMKTFFTMQDPWGMDLPAREQPLERPALSWREAHARGQTLMAEQARHYGFTIEEESYLSYSSEQGIYTYGVKSDRDIGKHGATVVLFNAESGALKALSLPTGQYAGNTITTWLIDLHMAKVFGLPMQVFVCMMGLVVAMLSVTGIVIWLQKRRATKHRATRSALRRQL